MLAGADSPGAAPLEIDALCRHVAVLAARYEHVIVMPHWGRERFTIPSPEQTRWARRLIEAGARAVLGHHPHVLQGIERIGPGLAAYSLGNFAASPVYWTDGDRMDWNRRERTAGVLRLELRREGVGDAKLLTTRDTGGQVVPDAGRRTRRLVRRLDGRLERGIGPRAFRIEAFGVQTLRPILQHLRPRALMRLRWRNVRNGLRMLLGRRGG
jgi:poly-gamma-glutamate synthesis protein (capsule biosynthesis protein)